MKKIFLLICFIPAVCIIQAQSKKAKAKADKLTTANLQAHISYLASDALEGRRTGTPGEMKAMEYIKQQFEKNHLTPAGTNGYIQEFTIDEGLQLKDDVNSFSANDKTLVLKDDYFPFPFSANAEISGTGSPALNESSSPWFFDVADLLEENHTNPHFDIMTAVYTEASHMAGKGATAIIVYNSSSFTDNILFNKNDTTAKLSVPVVYVTHDAVQKFFGNTTDSYDLTIKVHLQKDIRTAHNLAGFINNNASTTVVLGAHFDHLGYGEDANSLDGFGQIHNGADDNASGTAALIELSRILQSSPAKNNNYLFIAFSGEELGLLGSKYWLEHPSYQIIPNYMINMDMVGRYDTSRKLTIGGYGTSPVWGELFKTHADKNLLVHYDSSGTSPSDHASFYRKDIPVLFFFTNSHSDYHKASDDADKINYTAETEIINYIKQIIEATNYDGRLAFTKTREQEMRSVALPVTLGVMPDYAYTGTGMRIDGVSKGKTAERIGLQAGDVLMQLGEYKFVDVQSYMGVLQKFHRGDKTQLHILRGAKEIVFDVQF